MSASASFKMHVCACLVKLCLQKRFGKGISNITYTAPGIITYLVISMTFHCISYTSMFWFYLKSVNTLYQNTVLSLPEYTITAQKVFWINYCVNKLRRRHFDQVTTWKEHRTMNRSALRSLSLIWSCMFCNQQRIYGNLVFGNIWKRQTGLIYFGFMHIQQSILVCKEQNRKKSKRLDN